jgi:succinate dehydrogenase / fumarate reductase cytochrome b subunit
LAVVDEARTAPWPVEFYRSAVGKKWVMAVTGLVLLGYVLFHMLGNLKLYLGPESINSYGEGLREFGAPFTPRTFLLWVARDILILAFLLHVHATYSLTLVNRRARPKGELGPRDYAVANYASRTMRWSGVIVGLFVIFHLMDLTWGMANPDFVRGDVYHNMVASFSRWPVALVYVVANAALALHIYHGAWSLFQSMGWNHPRFNHWRRWFAVAFAWVILIANVSFPIAVVTGVVS